MNVHVQAYFEDIGSTDKEAQYEAYKNILVATENKVDWAYEIWGKLLENLSSPDNHKRSRAAQFLSRLAISDPEKRILKDFPDLWEVTKDKRFVTARHSLQSIWRVGLAGEEQKEMVLKHLTDRFKDCTDEKNYTLIRFDIIQGLKRLYVAVNDPKIKQIAIDLVATEEDDKYRKKYASVW